MSNLSLDERFKEAVRIANEQIPKPSVPQDVQLVLYAYYKQALSENISYGHHGYESMYRDWETDRKSTRLNSSH